MTMTILNYNKKHIRVDCHIANSNRQTNKGSKDTRESWIFGEDTESYERCFRPFYRFGKNTDQSRNCTV